VRKLLHSMACDYPEGCSCGATEFNRWLDFFRLQDGSYHATGYKAQKVRVTGYQQQRQSGAHGAAIPSFRKPSHPAYRSQDAVGCNWRSVPIIQRHRTVWYRPRSARRHCSGHGKHRYFARVGFFRNYPDDTLLGSKRTTPLLKVVASTSSAN